MQNSSWLVASIPVLKPPQNMMPPKKPTTSRVNSANFTLGLRKNRQKRRNAPGFCLLMDSLRWIVGDTMKVAAFCRHDSGAAE